MDDKESYTPKEVEEMIKVIRIYNLYRNNYSYISMNDINCITAKKEIESARKKLDESIKSCKEKIPKSLLNKINLRDSNAL